MTETVRRISLILPWLAERKFMWLSVTVIGAALAWSLRPGTQEPTIRLIGLALQLLGVATVIWGISETRALFGHPAFVSELRAWVSRFPLFKRKPVASAGGGGSAVVTLGARGHGTHGPGANPTIESRLHALEKEIASLHERINQTQNEMDAEFRKAAEELERERSSRTEEASVLRTKLEATGTGGVHISAIGASWLFIGVTLSTASPEIASWVK